ncbi:MAG TPA: hypothetical protein VIV09_07400 [Pseudolabrys sp.]
MLENMGFRVVDERTYHIQPEGHAGAWFHDMLLERRDGGRPCPAGRRAARRTPVAGAPRRAALLRADDGNRRRADVPR